MLFNNDDRKSSDRIIYQTKPNILFGCKKAVYGVILLIIIIMLSSMVIRFIGEMQVYLISYIKLPLTRYVSIAVFVAILIDILYIIWQLIGWQSTEYFLTEFKIIIKTGVISTKKNYIPYTNIQDLNTSQSIFARLLNVGSIYVFSAYDNSNIELKNISNPSEVEDIIFSKIRESRNIPSPQVYENPRNDNYYMKDQYRDEIEPIAPITHENYNPRHNHHDNFSQHNIEYEAYGNKYGNSPKHYNQDSYYNEVRGKYSYVDEDYYENNESEIYYNDGVDEFTESDGEYIDDTSQNVIQRHFDKFKK